MIYFSFTRLNHTAKYNFTHINYNFMSRKISLGKRRCSLKSSFFFYLRAGARFQSLESKMTKVEVNCLNELLIEFSDILVYATCFP